jgi:hypothetical protein
MTVAIPPVTKKTLKIEISKPVYCSLSESKFCK